MIEHVHWIALLPLISAVIVLLFGKEGPHSKMPYLSVATMGWCLLHSICLFAEVVTDKLHLPYTASMPWFEYGQYPMNLGVLIDGAAIGMLVVVTLVSFLVQVYSLGYMHGDPRFKRYYAYLSFFTASMLGLVISSNLLVVFMCWELVGVSSYLLIGFWFEKPGPAYASKKAFITTKLGDLGFYIGLLLLFAYTGTFELTMLKERAAMGVAYLPVGIATIVGLCLLGGAIGKSAQWPLFIWLPDAMEGPTPVSALIHAATMVAAGIYLVARTYFIYQMAPVAMETVAWVGLVTAFLAATMAIVAYDIKRVLAFSTISQLGYMMLGLGVGGYSAGLFHLTTHAFFKALLFLGAGSVIHGVHTNDMRKMGGLSRQMPVTFTTMGIATLAIAGMWPFAGFYSKEAILTAVYEHNPTMWAIALVTAGITTFYMFRMMFMAFGGSSRDHEQGLHAHESPLVMTIPLGILATLALVSGFAMEHGHIVEKLFELPALSEGAHGAALAQHPHPWFLLWGALGVLAAGAGLSWKFYGGVDFALAEGIKTRLMPIFSMLENRYGFDALFLKLVDASDRLAAVCFWMDDRIVDRIFVDGWGFLTILLSEIHNFFDIVVVDAAVDAVGTLSRGLGWVLRAFMRGQVQQYLLYVALAVSLFVMGVLAR